MNTSLQSNLTESKGPGILGMGPIAIEWHFCSLISKEVKNKVE